MSRASPVWIRSAADIVTWVVNTRGDVEEHGLVRALVDAIQAADHLPYGMDWAPWLDRHVDRLVDEVASATPTTA